MEPRPADLMCVCIARHVRDGEILAQGLATPLVAAGFLLAWRMHAPHVYFASAIGQSVCREGAPIGLCRVEELWLERALRLYGFVPAAGDSGWGKTATAMQLPPLSPAERPVGAPPAPAW